MLVDCIKQRFPASGLLAISCQLKPQFIYFKTIKALAREVAFRICFVLADLFGFWRYPSRLDVSINRNKRLARINWFYKALNPVIRAEKGSGLQDYFLRHQQAGQAFIPKGFQTKHVARLSAVGDLMRATCLENSKDKLYSTVSDLIFGADISFANLESTVIQINNNEKGTHVWVTEDEYDAFKGHDNHQYTVFSTANNHILDGGTQGVESVHDMLNSDGFGFVGTNPTSECQREGLIIDSNGIRFGFLAATFAVNKAQYLKDRKYLVNVVPFNRAQEETDLSLLETQIEWCRSKGCDFIIASLHWGQEFEFFPRSYQIHIAHELVELGVDALFGHHSHTIQPYEVYQPRRDPDRKVPIFYSLGNLVSWSRDAYRCLSLVSQIGVVKGRINGSTKTLVSNLEAIPLLLVTHESEDKSYLQLHTLAELACSSTYSSTYECASEFISDAIPYADLVLGERWRDDNGIIHS